MWPLVSDDPRVQADYETMREDGQGHNFAEMCALQRPPNAIGTDSNFWRGGWNNNVPDEYRQQATAAGVSMTGKRYLGQLARFPGDPSAWVAGTGDIKAICESRGWGCDGAVKTKKSDLADVQADPQPYKVADDLIDEKMERVVEENPDLLHNRQQLLDVREKIEQKALPSPHPHHSRMPHPVDKEAE